MPIFRRDRCAWIGFALALASLVSLPVIAGDSFAALSKRDRQELWSSNIALLERVRSENSIDTIIPPEPVNPKDERVARWLDDYRRAITEHQERQTTEFERYVQRATGHIEKNEIREALIEANRARDNAVDTDAMLQSEWMKQLTNAAVDLAQQYRDNTEWRRAYEVYYNLSDLYPDRDDLTKAKKDCLTYARLDAMYEKDGGWAERLEDIVPRNASDALDRIERFYVERADFMAITRSAYESLLLICDSKVMRETFDGLAGDDLREQFRLRLQKRLKRINNSDRFTVAYAQEYFRRALTINEQTVNLPESLIVYEYVAGALDPLDEFTSVIWPVEFREFDKHTRGDFVGVGISINGGGDKPINVVSPLEDTPAYRAGILPEDQITHVNGQSLEGVSLTKAVGMITGPIRSEVTLTIRRESEGRTFDVVLVRDNIEIQSVRGYTRDPNDPQVWDFLVDKELGIAYVRVNSFQDNTVSQMQNAIDQAIDQGAKGLILDLRFNPGGLLKTAVEVTRLFQSRDEKVVSTRGLRDEPWEPPPATVDGPYKDLPLILLVNEYSASASEIVAGALEDNARAVVLGQRTYGKFSVQKLMELGGSIAHLKLTTARYYLPLGRSLHHDEGAETWGVEPDVAVNLIPKEIYRVRQMQTEREILAKAGKKKDALEQKESDPSADPAVPSESADEQLDHAGADTDENEKSADNAASHDLDKKADDTAVTDEMVDLDGDAVADGEEDADDEDRLNLAPDPNEVPDVDLQLDTAVLLFRLHLLGQSTPQLAVGEREPQPQTAVKE